MLANETGIVEWRRGEYLLSTDRQRLDMDRVHHFLANESYWAKNIARGNIARSIEGSIAVGLYHGDLQIGFARVVTDCTRFAYLMDVFVDRQHRGQGLGVWLAAMIRQHPDLTTVARWLLTTVDAHQVYERAGWKPVQRPDYLMEVCKG